MPVDAIRHYSGNTKLYRTVNGQTQTYDLCTGVELVQLDGKVLKLPVFQEHRQWTWHQPKSSAIGYSEVCRTGQQKPMQEPANEQAIHDRGGSGAEARSAGEPRLDGALHDDSDRQVA